MSDEQATPRQKARLALDQRRSSRAQARAGARVSPEILTREDAYKRALSLTEAAFEELEFLIEHGEPREKVDAIRVLTQAIGHLSKEDVKAPDTRTPEEKREQLRMLVGTDDVRAFLEAEGWEKKKPKPEKPVRIAKGEVKP